MTITAHVNAFIPVLTEPGDGDYLVFLPHTSREVSVSISYGTWDLDTAAGVSTLNLIDDEVDVVEAAIELFRSHYDTAARAAGLAEVMRRVHDAAVQAVHPA